MGYMLFAPISLLPDLVSLSSEGKNGRSPLSRRISGSAAAPPQSEQKRDGLPS